MASIEVFSDFLCPFCYVAEASTLAKLQNQHPDLEVIWRGFELHPEIPRGGVAITEFFPAEAIAGFTTQLTRLASDFGLETLKVPNWLPNTMKAHALTEYARSRGKQRPVREAIMDAYWRQGLNIEDDEVLIHIAAENGLNPDRARDAIQSHDYEMRVIQNRAAGYERGVAGVPTYFVNGHAVVGCQGMCAIEAALNAS